MGAKKLQFNYKIILICLGIFVSTVSCKGIITKFNGNYQSQLEMCREIDSICKLKPLYLFNSEELRVYRLVTGGHYYFRENIIVRFVWNTSLVVQMTKIDIERLVVEQKSTNLSSADSTRFMNILEKNRATNFPSVHCVACSQLCTYVFSFMHSSILNMYSITYSPKTWNTPQGKFAGVIQRMVKDSFDIEL